VILDDAKGDEIGRHYDDGYDPCDCRDCGREDGAAETRADCKEEGDESEAAGNGVEDHNSSKGFGGINGGGSEGRLVNAFHDGCGVVADDPGEAVILIGLYGRNIEDAVAKGSECDRGVANIGLVGEHHLQDCDVTNDRRRDGGD